MAIRIRKLAKFWCTLAYIFGVCWGNCTKLLCVMCPHRGIKISASDFGGPSPLKFWSRKTDTAVQARDKSSHVLQCRIKMGAIDAAALGPFVKYAHGVDDIFLFLFSVCSSLRTAGSGVTVVHHRLTASCSLQPPQYVCSQAH